MNSLFYTTDPREYNIYLKDNIAFEVQNNAPIDLLVAHIIDYLNDQFPKFAMTTGSSGSQVTFVYGYPEDSNIKFRLPAIAVEVRDEDNYQDSMGYIQYFNKDTGDWARGINMVVTLQFDIWAENTMERQFIQGILMNALHAGIVDLDLRYRGIQIIDFKKSIPRGYDQTDRVLQFHTHQIGSDEIFRQVVEYIFTFDHRLSWATARATPDGIPYAITQIILNEENEDITSVSIENRTRQSMKMNIS